MRTAGLLLTLIIATTLPATAQSSPPAADAPAKPAAETPARPAADSPAKANADTAPKPPSQITQALADTAPKYAPPAPPKPEVAPDPDVLALPKMTIIPKKRPRLGDEVMMTNKAFNEKLAKEKTSSFDRDFLNKYNWLGGASAAERAREEYDRQQREQLQSDVARMAKVVDQIDPAQAKALRDAASKP